MKNDNTELAYKCIDYITCIAVSVIVLAIMVIPTGVIIGLMYFMSSGGNVVLPGFAIPFLVWMQIPFAQRGFRFFHEMWFSESWDSSSKNSVEKDTQ